MQYEIDAASSTPSTFSEFFGFEIISSFLISKFVFVIGL
jgi:hypothetical protein